MRRLLPILAALLLIVAVTGTAATGAPIQADRWDIKYRTWQGTCAAVSCTFTGGYPTYHEAADQLDVMETDSGSALNQLLDSGDLRWVIIKNRG